ncbi:unnamed protein product [Ilex paraguariensis]|uniref:Uncharacterized protein n=1 Tax=Ilex paraguariensis TaxID=185542 RepID=A0ABC8TY11_9AQUA
MLDIVFLHCLENSALYHPYNCPVVVPFYIKLVTEKVLFLGSLLFCFWSILSYIQKNVVIRGGGGNHGRSKRYALLKCLKHCRNKLSMLLSRLCKQPMTGFEGIRATMYLFALGRLRMDLITFLEEKVIVLAKEEGPFKTCSCHTIYQYKYGWTPPFKGEPVTFHFQSQHGLRATKTLIPTVDSSSSLLKTNRHPNLSRSAVVAEQKSSHHQLQPEAQSSSGDFDLAKPQPSAVTHSPD